MNQTAISEVHGLPSSGIELNEEVVLMTTKGEAIAVAIAQVGIYGVDFFVVCINFVSLHLLNYLFFVPAWFLILFELVGAACLLEGWEIGVGLLVNFVHSCAENVWENLLPYHH